MAALCGNALWHIGKTRAELGSLLSQKKTIDSSEDYLTEFLDVFSSLSASKEAC